jgi:calcineurin-like phosphoesterase family protein
MYRDLFTEIHGFLRYKNVWLSHVPIHPQEMYRCEANVHGHIHKNSESPELPFPYINVNWDYWQRPVSLEEIRNIIRDNKKSDDR